MNSFRWLPWCSAVLFLFIASPALSIEEATIADLQTAHPTGELTTRHVVTACLARIEAYDTDSRPYLFLRYQLTSTTYAFTR